MRRLTEHSRLLIAAALLAALSLSTDSLCFYRAMTGMPCPGCGLTRAWASFFQGDLSGALHWHPLFSAVPVLLAVVLFRNTGAVRKISGNNSFWIGVVVLFVGVYAWRMVRFFPHTAPMDYYWHSIAGRVVRALIRLWD